MRMGEPNSKIAMMIFFHLYTFENVGRKFLEQDSKTILTNLLSGNRLLHEIYEHF